MMAHLKSRLSGTVNGLAKMLVAAKGFASSRWRLIVCNTSTEGHSCRSLAFQEKLDGFFGFRRKRLHLGHHSIKVSRILTLSRFG